MNIRDIFEKDVHRPIEGVVKADDSANLGIEVDEYVLTNEAAKELEQLLEEYVSPTTANGVWISGFYGSGKSHMLKMLAHLLGEVDGQDFSRDRVSQAFRAKSDGQFLAGLLNKSDKVEAKSLLFNIDQKAAVITKDATDALLKVFVRVFDESRGYFGNQGHVARFERDLDGAGHYLDFQQAFLRITGKGWLVERQNYIVQGANVDKAYAQVLGEKAPTDILKQYSSDYSVSIEDFATEVTNWIEQQTPGFRVNFFVDEVGQFIGDDTKLMLNLQTIAESLNTKAKGQAWVFVTSQEDMDKTIGDQTKKQAQDFSKIQARFKTRVKLTSQNVEEVIRKRLLQKNELGTAALKGVYLAESANFKTLFDFADGAKMYQNFATEDRFVGTYPFVSYQFPLFQQAIQGLSEHNAFEGKNSSVGERSMLGVVQHVAKELGAAPIGVLASFEGMFEGIRSSLKSAPQKQILLAENQLQNKLAIRLLKALFLVKFVDGFRSTPRNLTVLVYDRFGLNGPALQIEVSEALAQLEQQTYIQRNGEVYAYLTNEEQDIEKEIKGVEVDSLEVSDRLFKLLHDHAMKQQQKFRYAKTDQDFPLGYKLDDVAKSKPKELTLHFITPDYSQEFQNIRMQSAGLAELRVVIEADDRLLSDLRLLLKTEKYVKQKQGTAITDSQKRILDSRQQENLTREKELAERIKQAVSKASLVVDTVEVPSVATGAESRIADGMNVLVAKTYPQLALLGGRSFPELDVIKYVQPDDGALTGVGSELDLPSEEIYKQGVLQRDKLGEQITVKKLVDDFQSKPYGWDYGSVLCVIAHLCGKAKITLELDNVSLKRSEVSALLRNSQRHATIVVRKQAKFDEPKVRAFHDFVKDFFDDAAPPKDPMDLARLGSERLKAELAKLRAIVHASRYPFTSALQAPIELLEIFSGKPDAWFLSDFSGGAELNVAKSDVLVPIDQFINGPQAGIYDAARTFRASAAENLGYLPAGSAALVDALLVDPEVFRGNKVNQLKVAEQSLKDQIAAMILEERASATGALLTRQANIRDSEFFENATESAQQKAIGELDFEVKLVEVEMSISKLKLVPKVLADSIIPRIYAELEAAPLIDPGHPSGEVGEPVAHFVPFETLNSEIGNRVLTVSSDVDDYIEKLRTILLAAIAEGKRISL